MEELLSMIDFRQPESYNSEVFEPLIHLKVESSICQIGTNNSKITIDVHRKS